MKESDQPPQVSGFVVMIGGRSRRMQRDKWSLPFGDSTFLQTLIDIGRSMGADLVVSIGHDQNPAKVIDHLGDDVAVVQDRHPNQGPLEGIRQSLFFLEDRGIGKAFVTGCDSPELRPDVVRRLLENLDGNTAVVPRDSGHVFGLTAAYETGVWKVAERMLAEGRNRVTEFVRELNARQLDLESFRDVDPDLASFRNINTPEDFGRLGQVEQ